MCDLPNGRTEYASWMSRDEAMKMLLSIGAEPRSSGYGCVISLTLNSEQKDYLERACEDHAYLQLHPRRTYVQGEVYIHLDNNEIRVDGDVKGKVYDDEGEWWVSVPFCSGYQDEMQKAALNDLAERIRKAIAER